MPIWPKSLYFIGENLATARTAWGLRRKHAAVPAQQRIFADLIRRLAATSYWREAGVLGGMDYEAFRTRVAPRSAEQLAPAIARMQHGEADVLWPGRCAFFIHTAGTTTGQRRLLPVTAEQLVHFRTATHEALMYYTAQIGHAGVFRGRHLMIAGSPVLTPIAEAQPQEAYETEFGGILALSLPRWVERHVLEPGMTVARLTDWDQKLQAIADQTCRKDIALIAGMPKWTLALAELVCRACRRPNGHPVTNIHELWPNLECFVHGGSLLAPFQAPLRAVLGPSVRFHEVYFASEAVIAAQDFSPADGLRLITNAGIFYEFVPVTEFDPAHPELCGTHAVPLAGVKPGVDYAVLITTPAGLARYVLGDTVRFMSAEPPRLLWVGRTELCLRSFGELVTERDVTDTIASLCQRHAWTIVNFHVAPRIASSLTGQRRGAHEWWIELQPGTVSTPMGPQMAVELDADLQRTNADYASRRHSGVIDPPVVRLVMPGVFEHWLRFHEQWGGQHKTPRCRNDRLVADELAQITNFARD
jgi:hypothetical protein